MIACGDISCEVSSEINLSSTSIGEQSPCVEDDGNQPCKAKGVLPQIFNSLLKH